MSRQTYAFFLRRQLVPAADSVIRFSFADLWINGTEHDESAMKVVAATSRTSTNLSGIT